MQFFWPLLEFQSLPHSFSHFWFVLFLFVFHISSFPVFRTCNNNTTWCVGITEWRSHFVCSRWMCVREIMSIQVHVISLRWSGILSLKAPPNRREIFAVIAKLSLRILSWTGTYTATSGSTHTDAKKSRRCLRNCSDLFTVAACTVFVVAAYSAGINSLNSKKAPAVLCLQAP
jgi:hypothetical protein